MSVCVSSKQISGSASESYGGQQQSRGAMAGQLHQQEGHGDDDAAALSSSVGGSAIVPGAKKIEFGLKK